MDFENYAGDAELKGLFMQEFCQNLPPVRLKNSNQLAEEDMVRRYLEMALQCQTQAPVSEMQALAQNLNEDDLSDLARKLYHAWCQKPHAESRMAVFMLYGMHGNNADVVDLWQDVTIWLERDKNYRALALNAVLALGLSRSTLAPMLLEHISRNTANQKVSAAARNILATLVGCLGINWEELGDYIVPDLGFDDEGVREIKTDTGVFKAVIRPNLTLALVDADGVEIAVPPCRYEPAPPLPQNLNLGVPDDGEPIEPDKEAMAELLPPDEETVSSVAACAGGDKAQALKSFYILQKSFNTVVFVQSRRLRLFMLAGHNWDKEMWRRLFIYNPILRRFSQTLVWGVYKYNVLYDTFICNPCGAFTREDGSPFDFEGIDDEGRINPAHPLEMDAELLAAWRGRIERDGIIQPVRQMAYQFTGSQQDVEDEFDFMAELGDYDVHILKGFDADDCSDENIYQLEYLGHLLGVEGKELFLDVYHNGHIGIRERALYSLSCEAGDKDMDAIVSGILLTPAHPSYPRLIQVIERHKNPRWLKLLHDHLRYGIKKRRPNDLGARGLLHAGLSEYYEVARDIFILHWEDDLPTDMGIYAFESDALRAVGDILPYIIKINAQNSAKAGLISLHGIIQAAYRNLTPAQFYEAFLPVFNNVATRESLVEAFISRIKYGWNKRDLAVELERDVPVKQLLTLDYRWYVPFLAEGLVDFVVHSVTGEMPAAPLMDIFKSLVDRNFESFEELENFYKYALGMLALGHKDFMYETLARVKTLMPKLPYKRETMQRLAYYMEREATAFGEEFWIQQFILLDPVGFAGVFETMCDKADDESKAFLKRVLTAVYVIAYKQ